MELANMILAAKGTVKAELVLKNAQVADVFSGQWIKADIAIGGGKILGLGQYAGEREIDLAGKQVIPGLIDTHVHIESSMVTPFEYARAVLPRGVTTVIADPHEIANVAGFDGIDYLKESACRTPLRVYWRLPSCVPATPFEDSGEHIDSAGILSHMSEFCGLGEMMNFPGVLSADPECLKKLCAAGHSDGHAPLLSGNDLNAYIAAGIHTDHECTTPEELLEKVSKGLYVNIREGTLSKDLAKLIPAVTEEISNRCLFCTDDRSLPDIALEGTIDYCVREAMRLGLAPFAALRMATLNAAQCYNLPQLGAIAPGYLADLVVLDSFTDMRISMVFREGQLVSDDLFCHRDSAEFPKGVLNTVHLPKLSREQFLFPGELLSQPIISIVPGTIVTKRLAPTEASETVTLCVLERHKASGKRGYARVYGSSLRGGAIASSVGHDSHNISVIGDNAGDMLLACSTLGNCGGIAVAAGGEVLCYMPLPIAGLITEWPYEQALAMQRALSLAVQKLHIKEGIDIFMALAFLPLPVIPELRCTARGLFDVNAFSFVSEDGQ